MQARSLWIAAALGVVAVLLTLASTAQYGAFNQATYLLDPMQRAMPELFQRDWFVSDTPPYLPVFGWLAQWLYWIDPEGPAAVLTAHVIVTLASYAALYWLIAAAGGTWRTSVLVASFTTLTLGRSMGANYLLVGYLQPSSLSTLGWLVAMAAFVRARYLACGIALALAGAVHVNFLVLGIGLFALTALVCRDVSRRDFVMLLAPQLAVLACFLPQLLAAVGPSDEAVRILVDFHSAHYSPAHLVRWIPVIAGWQLAAYAAKRLGHDDTRERTALWWFALVACVIAVTSSLAMRYLGLESLTEARWSRIAPFGQLACQILIAIALERYATATAPRPLAHRIAIGTAIITAFIFASRYMVRQLPLTPALVGSACIAVILLWPRIARHAMLALVALALAYALWASPRGKGLTTEPYATPGERTLAAWVREHTAVDALFVVPPDLGRFRVLARRAVVVDLKSPPLRPDLLVAWYRRLCTLVHLDEAPTYGALEAAYTKLTPAQLEASARLFDADYIIVGMPTPFATPPVFANGEFAVYRAKP